MLSPMIKNPLPQQPMPALLGILDLADYAHHCSTACQSFLCGRGASQGMSQFPEELSISSIGSNLAGGLVPSCFSEVGDQLNRGGRAVEGDGKEETASHDWSQGAFVAELKGMLQSIIVKIHDSFSKNHKEFEYFMDFAENMNEEAVNMCKFIQKTIDKVADLQSRSTKTDELIKQMRLEHFIMSKNNEQLIKHIEDRKAYSQKLKQKIQEQKQQINRLNNQIAQLRASEAIFAKVQGLELELDLNYQSRKHLISIIKCLSTEILAHERECSNKTGKVRIEDISKMMRKSFTNGKKTTSELSHPEKSQRGKSCSPK